jgi:GNAT superfamily N-acetyltransferase
VQSLNLSLSPALSSDAAECVALRGRTRENAVSESRLRELGITASSWGADIASGVLPGFVCRAEGRLVGYCFGNARTGEVVVLALLPEYEGQGLGRRLLELVVQHLRAIGHNRLFLGCSSDPSVRSFGFYRHLGWRATGETDALGDQVLELHIPEGQ